MLTGPLGRLADEALDEVRRGLGPDHTVGAALLTAGGRVVRGLNTHHYLGGPCAEIVALSNHAARFPRDPVRAVVAVHGPTRRVIAPCGMCRQILFELDPGIECIVPGPDGPEAHRIDELLPHPYDRAELALAAADTGDDTDTGDDADAGSGHASGTGAGVRAAPGPAAAPESAASPGADASPGPATSAETPSSAASAPVCTASRTLLAGSRSYIVERARAEHVQGVVELLADDVLGHGRERAEADAYLGAFEEIDADPQQFLAVVLGEDGGLAGTMQLTILPGLSRGGARRLQIEAVRIAAGERGGGLGSAMIAWAEDYGRSRGAVLAQLTSDNARSDAHRFYARLGYEPSHTGFKKSLGDGVPR